MFKSKSAQSNLLKTCILYKQKVKTWLFSKVLLSQLTIKPPIFEEKFYQFSQFLFIMISASLPSTLSCLQTQFGLIDISSNMHKNQKYFKFPEYMIKISIFYEFWVKILRKFISWFPSFGTQGDDISRSIEVVANQFKDSPTLLLLQ